jgi:dextranase
MLKIMEEIIKMNYITKLDCYPDKAQYFDGETVHILLEADTIDHISCINITVSELEQIRVVKKIEASDFGAKPIFYRLPLMLPRGNYGVDVEVSFSDSINTWELHTAFDIANPADYLVRYGFLTDFSHEEKEDLTDITFAKKLHLNTLQFYDWMYRHDNLVSLEEDYLEPLGREISLQTIKNKINVCKENGIRPFAYGAVYAASKEAYEKHPSWAVFKKNGEPLYFADWLVFMNVSKDTPWSNHILKEYVRAIKELGFQGIHMDTYGFPKFVWDDKQNRLSLAESFPDMIQQAKKLVKSEDPRAGVIFNAVNNWPVEYVASSEQDAVYIEVWPPHVTYYHLYQLIREAKYLGGKQVILAAYMEPFKDATDEADIRAAYTSLLLTNAVIQASGGTQLVFGETNGVLCDSYYVNYATLQENFLPTVRAYCDFTVRYVKLLFDSNAMDISMTAVNGINEDIKLSVADHPNIKFTSCGEPGKVWSLIKETSKYTIIQLINLTNVNEFWNQPKFEQPEEIHGIQMDLLMDAEIKGVYYATPDESNIAANKIDYSIEEKENGQHILFEVPSLKIWDVIWIEVK